MCGNAVLSKLAEARGRIERALSRRKFKNARVMDSVSSTAVQLLFPGTPAFPQMRSFSAVREDELKLDLSLMLTQRDLSWRDRCIRSGWADSSPQGPFNWLMWKCMYVKQKDLVSAVAAAVELTLSPGGIMEDRGIEVDPDLADFEPTMYEGRR